MTEDLRAARLLLAGSAPGGYAGNSVSTEVLLAALTRRWSVDTVSHRIGVVPGVRRQVFDYGQHWTLTAQPLTPHVEGYPAALVFRDRFHFARAAWVVNSRYAATPLVARIPYVLWEATTFSDEMLSTSVFETRRAGRGTGLGAALHSRLVPLNRRIERFAYDHAAVLLAMSAHTRECMIEEHGIAPGRVSCLLHPPTPAFLTVLERRRAVRVARPNSGQARLLFVGRVDDPRKNFDLLREAYKLARATTPMSLTVIGPHTVRWRLQSGVHEERDGISLRGAVSLEALVDAYLSHDLLVLSSRQEGFGIVVAEAMHAGLPVISTRCGGPVHVLATSGGGMLVDHDPSALANALVQLAEDASSRRAMGEKARNWAQRELSFEEFAGRVEIITREALERWE